MSVLSSSPSVLFAGTTWSQLKDRFLLGAGDIYALGSIAGSATHTLTEGEMPSHQHRFFSDEVADANGYTQYGADTGQGWQGDGAGANFWTTVTGTDLPHNNMPPYLVVYMWKRTA
jgi:microcystin-dependent protein